MSYDVTSRAQVAGDARQRAVRTLVQGLVVDLLVVLGAGAAAIQGGATVQQAVTLVIAALTKTAAQAVASWAARYVSPPAAVQPDTGEHVAP